MCAENGLVCHGTRLASPSQCKALVAACNHNNSKLDLDAPSLVSQDTVEDYKELETKKNVNPCVMPSEGNSMELANCTDCNGLRFQECRGCRGLLDLQQNLAAGQTLSQRATWEFNGYFKWMILYKVQLKTPLDLTGEAASLQP